MAKTLRYLTHPQVNIDPNQDITQWHLSVEGRARVLALVKSGALTDTTRIISSSEVKALETARPLADALGIELEVRPGMHENDRSATGFLPPDEFETVADEFFLAPSHSVRGWETAQHAQDRIVAEVTAALACSTTGDTLVVGHGAVGTLLYCALADLEIDRCYDQGPGGGGNYILYSLPDRTPQSTWKPMEALYAP